MGSFGRLNWAATGRRCAGERVNGDLALVIPREQDLLVAIFDGLGHGSRAHEASQAVLQAVTSAQDLGLLELMDRAHRALRPTVGGALGLGTFAADGSRVVFGGVGNTTARRIYPTSQSLGCSPGLVGKRFASPTLHETSLKSDDVWLLHTDGVSRSFGLEEYPQARYQSAGTVARSVVRRFSNDFDDATCVAVRVSA